MRPYVILLALAGSLFLGVIASEVAYASSLKIAPLTYEENIEGQTKKGFVDISNPSAGKVTVNIEVQAFRQVNNDGGLEFYDDPLVTAGITPDLKTFELGPREAIRMYFGIDSQKLPKRQVFAAILARTVSPEDKQTSISPSARVGTLLLLSNGGKGVENGSIVGIDVPWLQLGEAVRGSVTYRNTGTGKEANGYFPEFAITSNPNAFSKMQKGSLLFPGIQRETKFAINGDYFGVYKLTVAANQNTASQNILVITGFWRWLLPLILVVICLIISVGYNLIKRHRRKPITLHGSKL